jgi:hypothetical protein
VLRWIDLPEGVWSCHLFVAFRGFYSRNSKVISSSGLTIGIVK